MSVNYPPIKYVLARLYRQACLHPPPWRVHTHTHYIKESSLNLLFSFFLPLCRLCNSFDFILRISKDCATHCIAAFCCAKNFKNSTQSKHHHHVITIMIIIQLTVQFYDSTSAPTSFLSGPLDSPGPSALHVSNFTSIYSIQLSQQTQIICGHMAYGNGKLATSWTDNMQKLHSIIL